MTYSPTPNPVSIDKTVPDKAGDVEMKNHAANEPQSTDSKSTEKSSDKANLDNASADGSAGRDVEMKDLNAQSPVSKSAENSSDKANPENAGADGSTRRDIEMNDLNANNIQSAKFKSGEDAKNANQEPEVESFLRGITDHLKWQELVSKWLAFERDHPIKGVFYFLYSSFIRC